MNLIRVSRGGVRAHLRFSYNPAAEQLHHAMT
jgi:hypothetical protein